MNKTAIAAKTNRHVIRAKAPSKYVKILAEEAGAPISTIAGRIEGHKIAFDHLAADAFDAFFDARRGALLDMIAAAMGKEIVEAPAGAPEAIDEYELDDEELDDTDVEGGMTGERLLMVGAISVPRAWRVQLVLDTHGDMGPADGCAVTTLEPRRRIHVRWALLEAGRLLLGGVKDPFLVQSGGCRELRGDDGGPMVIQLSRLQTLDPREVWLHEAHDFDAAGLGITAWLAERAATKPWRMAGGTTGWPCRPLAPAVRSRERSRPRPGTHPSKRPWPAPASLCSRRGCGRNFSMLWPDPL